MKHKHYNKIVAKAANMDLVVFERQHTATHDKELLKELAPDGNKAVWFHESCDYFLCLPQHKDACLHWLNGGKSQAEYAKASYPCWCDIDSDEANWSEGHIFMDKTLDVRIKPKKEKVWIGVYGKHVTENYFGSKSEAEKHVDESPVYSNCAHSWWQFIEIEIEVTN